MAFNTILPCLVLVLVITRRWSFSFPLPFLLLVVVVVTVLPFHGTVSLETTQIPSGGGRTSNRENHTPTSDSSSRSYSSYQDLFPSQEEEYDPFHFNPDNLFGSPYGGFARATASRLAALPLRLVTGSSSPTTTTTSSSFSSMESLYNSIQFGAGFFTFTTPPTDPFFSGHVPPTDRNTETTDISTQGETQNIPFTAQVPYFTYYDGQGRPFVCRVYPEDDVDIQSLTDSLFDVAMERHDMNPNVGAIDTNPNKNVHLDTRTLVQEKENKVSTQNQRSTIPRKIPSPTIPNTNVNTVITNNHIRAQLDKLKGICSQIHVGWWSYEWCHEKYVSQFHVHVEPKLHARSTQAKEKEMNPANARHAQDVFTQQYEYFVESVTNIGTYDSTHPRKILAKKIKDSPPVNNDDNNNNNDTPRHPTMISSSSTKNQKVTRSGFIYVQDYFTNGDYCPDIDQDRSMTVTLRCCRPEEWQLIQRQGGMEDNTQTKDNQDLLLHRPEDRYDLDKKQSQKEKDMTPKASLLSITEDETCVYSAVVCTNVLCRNSFLSSHSNVKDETEEVDSFLYAPGSDPLEHDSGVDHGISSSGTPTTTKTVVSFKKDDSIRYILKSVLGQQCLSLNLGWWTYAFCHTSKVTQFHVEFTVDPYLGEGKVGVTAQKQGEYVLGRYNIDSSERFPNQEEIDHIVFPDGWSTQRSGMDDGIVKNAAKTRANSGVAESNLFPDGSGAYYVEEYTHGDLCDHNEIADSPAKGIQRSTSVRFSCGKELQLLRVNEESTCRYVLDVTVPELCILPYFEAPVIKTQVVKCLPI